MIDGNGTSGKYTCPECSESYDDALAYGRHVRNAHPVKKHLKPIRSDNSEPKEIKIDIDRSPVDDYDLLEEIVVNFGIKRGKADNIRVSFENYEADNLPQLAELLRQNGVNKSTSFNVLSAYSSRLQIEFPMEIKERLKLSEMGSEPAQDDGDIISQVVKKRMRRHELFIAAKSSGMSNDDLELMFPEFMKKDEPKEPKETKKKRLFPPDSTGSMVELSDSEYSEMMLEWKRIKALNQQMPSDIELYQEIGQSLREAGLMANVRPVKDEVQLQMMTSSLKTIESRLNKTEPISSLIMTIVNKLNDSGKLPSLIDRALSRFEQPRPQGVPVHQYEEKDFEKLNQKLNQQENIYSQQINPEKSEEKPSDNTTDDEVSQLIGNVKSQKEMNQIMKKLEKIKNGN